MTPDPTARHYQYRLGLAMPAVSILLTIIGLSALPVPLPFGILPDFPLLFLLVWGALQPRLLPLWLVLLLGIVADAAEGLPVGVQTLVFPLAILMTGGMLTRFQSRSHLVDWISAAIVVGLATLVEWQLMAFLHQPTALLPLALQAATTILAFPLAVRACLGIEKRLRRWAD